MNEQRRERISAILDHYGYEAQAIVAIEELAELQKVATKYLRLCRKMNQNESEYGDAPLYERITIWADAIEEIADVYIMLEQLKTIFGVSEKDVNNEIDYKISRTEVRMKDDK